MCGFGRGLVLAVALLAAAPAGAQTNVEFVGSTRAHRNAARAYAAIWDEFGARIVAALETRSCLPFPENSVSAVVADAISNSGGPEHPMRLRATYDRAVKQSTLVHELGHRHLWQLVERLDEVDGHMTLYLILDRVWADVWGEEFAESRIRGESEWDDEYAEAWDWARALGREGRARIWNELLALNGHPLGCGAPLDNG